MSIFKQFGGKSEYWAKWNSIGIGYGDSNCGGIGQNVTSHVEISHLESLITDFQGRLVSNVCYRH